jgi:hypothetical protein
MIQAILVVLGVWRLTVHVDVHESQQHQEIKMCILAASAKAT